MKKLTKKLSNLLTQERQAKNLAWGLIAALALIAINIEDSNRATELTPTISSKAKGGLFILAESLRNKGYIVSSLNEENKPSDPNVLYISANKKEDAEPSFSQLEEESEESEKNQEELNETIDTFGTTHIKVILPKNLEESIAKNVYTQISAFSTRDNKEYKISIATTDLGKIVKPSGSRTILAVKENNVKGIPNTPIAYAFVSQGIQIEYAAGLSLANFEIGKFDNAAAFLDIIDLVAEPKSQIVFLESGYQSTGLISGLGPWATTALYQVLLLCIVMAYSVSKVFGLPITSLLYLRGSSDSIFAIGNLYFRFKQEPWARRKLAAKANQRLNRLQKLSRNKKEPEINELRLRIDLLAEQTNPLRKSISAWRELDAKILQLEEQLSIQKSSKIM